MVLNLSCSICVFNRLCIINDFSAGIHISDSRWLDISLRLGNSVRNSVGLSFSTSEFVGHGVSHGMQQGLGPVDDLSADVDLGVGSGDKNLLGTSDEVCLSNSGGFCVSHGLSPEINFRRGPCLCVRPGVFDDLGMVDDLCRYPDTSRRPDSNGS